MTRAIDWRSAHLIPMFLTTIFLYSCLRNCHDVMKSDLLFLIPLLSPYFERKKCEGETHLYSLFFLLDNSPRHHKAQRKYEYDYRPRDGWNPTTHSFTTVHILVSFFDCFIFSDFCMAWMDEGTNGIGTGWRPCVTEGKWAWSQTGHSSRKGAQHDTTQLIKRAIGGLAF